jgi:hypothetical protein
VNNLPDGVAVSSRGEITGLYFQPPDPYDDGDPSWGIALLILCVGYLILLATR